MSDELVDLELAVEVVADEAAHLGAALDATKGASLPHTAGNELECCRASVNLSSCDGRVPRTSGGNLLASGGNTNDDALAPALVAGLERRAHDADIARAVKGVVAATIRHLNQLVDNGLVLFEIIGVDEISRAEFFGPLLLGGVDVDDDNLGGLVDDGALDDRQADATGAKDGNVGALLDIGRHARGAVARGDAAAEQARTVHGRVGLHGDDRNVGEDRVLRKGRSAHEVQHILALALEAGGAVGHDALALGGANLAAEVRLARLAKLALFAFGGAMKINGSE